MWRRRPPCRCSGKGKTAPRAPPPPPDDPPSRRNTTPPPPAPAAPVGHTPAHPTTLHPGEPHLVPQPRRAHDLRADLLRRGEPSLAGGQINQPILRTNRGDWNVREPNALPLRLGPRPYPHPACVDVRAAADRSARSGSKRRTGLPGKPGPAGTRNLAQIADPRHAGAGPR